MTDFHTADLLVELGCEELPPGSLNLLSRAFFEGLCDGLESAGIEFDRQSSRCFHTPRRLAVIIGGTADRQPDRILERRGPALAAAFDDAGEATPAALGFAGSVGREVSELETLRTDQGEWLFCRVDEPGKSLSELIFPILEKSLAGLPVSRPMRWSDHDYYFVRPVHWLVVLHGKNVLEGQVYGQRSSRKTRGHRVHDPGPHEIPEPAAYAAVLEAACVLVNPETRCRRIEALASDAGKSAGGSTRITSKLLAEVNNLVEWPSVVVCSFEKDFLEVPQEAVIASMEDHQRFFPVLDPESNRLMARFIAITNIDSKDVAAVVEGYERVIRPRLADSRFFWEQDRKHGLETSLAALDGVVFQKELGSVGDKSRRISSISKEIADFIGIDNEAVCRAALLSKCDLVSQMVGEFPELQGIMGSYYAKASGERPEVCQAIGEHYAPRFSGDGLPGSTAGQILSLADRLDTLIGIFSIGLQPTGNKDPFALRRAALGVVRLLIEKELQLPLDRLLEIAATVVSETATVPPESLTEVRAFVLDRARSLFRELGFDARLINAVMAAPLTTLADLHSRALALRAFMQLPEAESLISANKRIGNILRKANQDISPDIDENNMVFEEERRLFTEVVRLESVLQPLYASSEYEPALRELSSLEAIVDAFFDAVMVMDEDPKARDNRLALLQRLKSLFDRVADLSLAG
jgi:glycyl-tRNA synthetase beta chain